MLNNGASEEMRESIYVENYMDSMEDLPAQIQRHATNMKELDIPYQALLNEMDDLRQQLQSPSNYNNMTAVKSRLVQLQEKLIQSQEIADEKMQSVQHILDAIEKKHLQLDANCKSLADETENDVSSEQPPHAASSRTERSNDCTERPNKRPRRAARIEATYTGYSTASSTSTAAAAHSSTSTTSTQQSNTNNSSANSCSSSQGEGMQEPTITSTTATAAASTTAATPASTSSSSSSSGGSNGVQSAQQAQQDNSQSSSHQEKTTSQKATSSKNVTQKKSATKKKKRKARAEREREDSPTELPIDPDEPTYCLCEQVSYGEMIGCDNDLCPIEWFHFSCVNLTHKPKGKWFCPKCRGDKPTVMKPRAQFLRELEKYNKEKEEKS